MGDTYSWRRSTIIAATVGVPLKNLKKNKKTHDKSHACQSLPPSLSAPIMNSWHFLLRVNYTLYERYRASFDISFPRWALTLLEAFPHSLPVPQGRRPVWPGLPSSPLSARSLGASQSWCAEGRRSCPPSSHFPSTSARALVITTQHNRKGLLKGGHTLCPPFPLPPPPPAHTQTGQVRHRATCFLKPEAITLERAPGGDMPLSGWGRVPQLLELSVLFFFFYHGSHT